LAYVADAAKISWRFEPQYHEILFVIRLILKLGEDEDRAIMMPVMTAVKRQATTKSNRGLE
jgi:hypothetical protein